MLKGIDISHHNWGFTDLEDLNSLDFIIMKGSEGVRFKDPRMRNYLDALRSDMLRGFYHFARPDLGNFPEAEADHFVSTISGFINGYTILALDVEAQALRVPDLDKWCKKWCERVYYITGVKPLIYCSAAECKRFKKTAEFGCGLWVAKWSDKKPTSKQIEPWEFWAIWQHTSSGIFSGRRVDLDVFNGSREQYLKYAKVADNGKDGDNTNNTRD